MVFIQNRYTAMVWMKMNKKKDVFHPEPVRRRVLDEIFYDFPA